MLKGISCINIDKMKKEKINNNNNNNNNDNNNNNNNNDLKYEIARIWKMKKVDVILVVIGALGTVTKNFDKWLEKLELDLTVEMLQRPCLLGTARIIRKVLDIK